MELFYENSGRSTFLVYKLQEKDEVDSIGLGMLGNNNIPGILPMTENHHDEESRLLFNVTSQISLTKLLMGKMSRKKILTVFISICDAFLEAESYLLDEDLFVLDKDYIFTNASTGAAKLVYLPIIREDGKANLSAFFKDLISSTRPDLEEDNNYVGEIFSFLNSGDVFDLVRFRELVYKLRQPRDSKKNKKESVVQEEKRERIDSYERDDAYEREARKEQEHKVEPDQNVEDLFKYVPEDENGGYEEEEKEEKKSFFGGLFKKKSRFGRNGDKADDEIPAFGFEIPGEVAGQFEVPGEAAWGRGGDKKQVEENNPADKKSKEPSGKGINDIPGPKIPAKKHHRLDDVDPEGYTIVGGDDDFDELTELGGDHMGAQGKKKAKAVRAYLTRVSNNERKEIIGDTFRIGRGKEAVDYAITGNKSISRVHADIIKRDGKYYISDLNSKNHTKVNGTELVGGNEYLLHSGDHIFLSKEEFIFTE